MLARSIRAACLQPCLQPDLGQDAEAGAEAGGEAGGGEAGGEGRTSTTGAVVAVIGMAHLAGVREALGRPDI